MKGKRGFRQYFIDMDGVLAIWDVTTTFRDTFRKGYFLSREPDRKILDLLQALQARGEDVTILTAAYLTTSAKEEKRQWLKELEVTAPVLFVPYGLNKSDFIPDINDEMILIDDYSRNLHLWESASARHKAVKYLNGVNGGKGTWKGASISADMSVEEMLAILEEI